MKEVYIPAILDALPKTGRLEVDIKVTADVNFSAYAAQQKVNGFVLSEISCIHRYISARFQIHPKIGYNTLS